MSGPKLRRWICPICEEGKLAPTRPRRDDVRRYCLPCSEETGRLVLRSSPAVEAERERKASAAKAKRERAAERAAEKERARYVVRTGEGEVDLRAELDRIIRLEAFGGAFRRGRKWRRPTLKIRRQVGGGRASYYSNEIRLSVLGRDRISLLALLLHEATHLAVGFNPRDGERHHGFTFRKTLRDAAIELFEIPSPDAALVDSPDYRYALDREIEKLAREVRSQSAAGSDTVPLSTQPTEEVI